jgi:hypothetical protein
LKSEKKEFISNLLIDNPFMRMSELGNWFWGYCFDNF